MRPGHFKVAALSPFLIDGLPLAAPVQAPTRKLFRFCSVLLTSRGSVHGGAIEIKSGQSCALPTCFQWNRKSRRLFCEEYAGNKTHSMPSPRDFACMLGPLQRRLPCPRQRFSPPCSLRNICRHERPSSCQEAEYVSPTPWSTHGCLSAEQLVRKAGCQGVCGQGLSGGIKLGFRSAFRPPRHTGPAKWGNLAEGSRPLPPGPKRGRDVHDPRRLARRRMLNYQMVLSSELEEASPPCPFPGAGGNYGRSGLDTLAPLCTGQGTLSFW